MKKTVPILLLSSSLLMSSCAAILNSAKQKVVIQTGDSQAQVYVDDKSIGAGAVLATKLKRDGEFHQIVIKREGYVDANYVVAQAYKSPWNIISWFPFGILYFIPPLVDAGRTRTFDFPRKLTCNTQDMLKTPKRENNQKYLYLASTGFDVTAIGGQTQEYRDYLNNVQGYSRMPEKIITKTDGKKTDKSTKELETENSIFTEKLNQILKNVGFVDTTNTLLKSFVNTVYIKGTVTKFDVNEINLRGNMYGRAMHVQLKVDWEIQDFYNETLLKRAYMTKSGVYTSASSTSSSSSGNTTTITITRDYKSMLENSMHDALLRSFYQLLEDSETKKLLEIDENAKSTKATTLVLTKPTTPINNLQDAIKATATVVVDKGHGSGFFVSPDGYMITNYHVVAGSKKITVKTNDDKSYEARIVQKNEFSDLALIKIDQKVEYAFTLPEKAVFSVGEECFAIGTPKSIELGQTLTKGIISATRDKAGQKIVQTDVSINSGNSGGALVSPKGNLIGIVSAKLMGIGVEGIAFGVLADDVLKYLNIKY